MNHGLGEDIPGIESYFLDDTPLEELLVSPGIEKLTLLPAGRSVLDATEWMGSPKMEALVRELKERYEDRYILFDTPGIHKPVHRMNRRMVATAIRSLQQVDVVLWLVDVTETMGRGDRFIQDTLSRVRAPVLLGVNKIDRV